MDTGNINVGDVLELTCESLAFGGDAIARKEGWVFFVSGALPQETVLAEILDKKNNFFRARLKQILKASPDRVPSPCCYFPECGGCQYLHLEYHAQLEAKKMQVHDALTRLGKIAFPPIKVVPSSQPFYYRNRVKFHILRPQTPDEPVRLGFMNAAGRSIVPIEHCMISSQDINKSIAPIAQQMAKSAESKTVSIRTRGQGQIDFWTENLPLAKGMVLREQVRDKYFETPSASFFQVHPLMTEALVQEVEGFLEPGQEALIDAYCGVGLFSVFFANRFQEVIGIEQDQDSVRWARKNARANGVGTAIFYEGRVERLLEKTLEKVQGKRATLLLDPPRDGCHKNIPELICQFKPRQVMYISCNPPTLARDLSRLAGAYRVTDVTVLDMFPQTMHCEVIVRLRPVDAA